MEDTWTGRDLPVLRAIVQIYDESGHSLRPRQIEVVTGLAAKTVQQALRALRHEQPPFVTDMTAVMGGEIVFVAAPTGHARRAVGAWPTAEGLADRIVVAMDAAADAETDEEKKSWLKKAAAYLGNAGRDVLVDVAATSLNKQMGPQ